MAVVDHAVSIGVADPDRLGVGGWSYGGILTNYVIAKTTRANAPAKSPSNASLKSIAVCFGSFAKTPHPHAPNTSD